MTLRSEVLDGWSRQGVFGKVVFLRVAACFVAWGPKSSSTIDSRAVSFCGLLLVLLHGESGKGFLATSEMIDKIL